MPISPRGASDSAQNERTAYGATMAPFVYQHWTVRWVASNASKPSRVIWVGRTPGRWTLFSWAAKADCLC
jgi:hypothetical protein